MVDLHNQPWKALYLIYEIITIAAIRTPLWLLWYIPKSNRPRPTWTLQRSWFRAVVVRLNQKLTPRVGNISFPPFLPAADHRTVLQGRGIKVSWVEPVPGMIVGDLKKWADEAGVECERIPGYWIDKEGYDFPLAEPFKPGEKIIYTLHGGGFIHQSGNPTDPIAMNVKSVLEHSTTVQRCFSLEYRLSTRPPHSSNPFPSALLDAIAGYNYLVNVVGYHPEDIIVEGDSAGGNLALALVRYLVQYHGSGEPRIPPPPGRLLLLCPWPDLGDSHAIKGSSSFTNTATDCLDYSPPSGACRYMADTYIGSMDRKILDTNPYLSPASRSPEMGKVSFEGFPKTFITVGDAEVMLDSVRYLKEKMVEDMGDEKVEYWEAPDSIHNFIVFGAPQEPERTQVLEKVAKWLASE
ncbi:AB hydrolase superfamily protein [Abortiporus biennis]